MLARVPWVKPIENKPTQKRLNRDRRRHLVSTVAAILRAGDPTVFAFEASCRHGIRSRLCLNGWGWQEADATAADIVAEALRLVGARRPPWAEGQPDWVQNGSGALIARTRCIRCHSRLEGIQQKFCSSLCADAHHATLERIQKAREVQAYDLVVNPKRRDWKFDEA